MTLSPPLGPHAAAPPSRAPGWEGDTGTSGRTGTGYRDGLALGTRMGWHWIPVWWPSTGWHWAPVWTRISLLCRNGTGNQYRRALGSGVGSYWAPVWAGNGHQYSKDRGIAQLPRAPGCHTGLGPAQGDIPGKGRTGHGDTPGNAGPASTARAAGCS